jgi:2-polyprenyl-3-methyl-5-hydroxy-6-metoxy-1,4-benzoquinol methylase
MVGDFEIEYYNQEDVWKNYDDNIGEIARAKKTICLIPDGMESILDIGCGNGIVTNMINAPFVVGLDFARIPLRQVRSNPIQASIGALPIKKQKFDLIILTEVLEHLDDKLYIAAIKELKRLNPKYYLITVPYNESISLHLCKCSVCGNVFNPSHHYKKFNDYWFKNEFEGYSLEKLEYTSYACFPNENLLRLRYKFEIYEYSAYCICNKCGNRALSPNRSPIKYMLDGLSIVDYRLKAIMNKRKPYHQMILLRRNDI